MSRPVCCRDRTKVLKRSQAKAMKARALTSMNEVSAYTFTAGNYCVAGITPTFLKKCVCVFFCRSGSYHYRAPMSPKTCYYRPPVSRGCPCFDILPDRLVGPLRCERGGVPPNRYQHNVTKSNQYIVHVCGSHINRNVRDALA